MDIISESVIEAPNIGILLPLYIDLIFKTEEFLSVISEADGIEYQYETKVWFGEPSIIRLIIYK